MADFMVSIAADGSLLLPAWRQQNQQTVIHFAACATTAA